MYCIFTISNYTWDAYTYVYSVLPANRMRLCVHTSMYTSGFLQVVPHTKCVWWASTSPSCDASKYSVRRTTSIDLRSHCVWRLGTGTVPLSPSHLVVYLAPTVLLKSVLLLPSLLLAQCTRSTLFISSHTSRRNVFLCITHRSHSIFFIVVTVQLALWRTNLSLAQCRVLRSHCIVILWNESLQNCPSQHFNDIQMTRNTNVYSVIHVTAQDCNPVYTRVCTHTVFSCQVCFKENRRLAFYRDDGSAWSVMVHQLSWAKVSTSTTSFELPSESTSGQTWSTYQVCDKWPPCQAADQSATPTLNCSNTSMSSKNSTCLQLNSSTRHKPNESYPSPSSTRLGWRFSETSHGPLPPERLQEGVDPPWSFSWTLGCFFCW